MHTLTAKNTYCILIGMNDVIKSKLISEEVSGIKYQSSFCLYSPSSQKI